MKLKLGSIAEEADKCRKAFANVKPDIPAWHCHHEILIERLTEPAENRIKYILSSKPEHEQALRLHLFRPFRGPTPKTLKEAYAKRQEAYAKRQEACAKWQEAYAKWQEAYAKWQEACAKWQEACAVIAHKKQCKNCPWNGKTIFA
jgi:hypothetical protein